MENGVRPDLRRICHQRFEIAKAGAGQIDLVTVSYGESADYVAADIVTEDDRVPAVTVIRAVIAASTGQTIVVPARIKFVLAGRFHQGLGSGTIAGCGFDRWLGQRLGRDRGLNGHRRFSQCSRSNRRLSSQRWLYDTVIKIGHVDIDRWLMNTGRCQRFDPGAF